MFLTFLQSLRNVFLTTPESANFSLRVRVRVSFRNYFIFMDQLHRCHQCTWALILQSQHWVCLNWKNKRFFLLVCVVCMWENVKAGLDPSSWTCGDVLDKSADPRVSSVDMLETLHVPSGLGKPLSSGWAGESACGKDVVWASLLILLHPWYKHRKAKSCDKTKKKIYLEV